MSPWSLEGMRGIVTGAGRGIGTSVVGTARTLSDLDGLLATHSDAASRLDVF